jgi:hypothetical protein
MKDVTVPTVKPALKQVISEAIRLRYTSHSSKESIETGNHYQSLILGDERTEGFRSGREKILDQIDFRGKRVLDLGANLGEISRAARARGAVLVDGYEFDPFFVELANAVNSYNGTTRVSFFERDITDPGVYTEHFDVVLALSVFVYLREVLSAVREITDGVLIVETHRLDDNLESTYLGPIGELFPHHAILGTSEWGTGFDPTVERAVIAFSKTDEALRSHLRGLRLSGGQFSAARRAGTEPDVRSIDVLRTPWYDTFFDAYAFESPERVLSEIDGTVVDLEVLARNGDLDSDGMSGRDYWQIYVQGALQHARGGEAGPGNTYYEMLSRYWNKDPGRAADFRDPDLLAKLVKRRFEDFDLFRAAADAPSKMSPARLVVPEGVPKPTPTRGVKRIYVLGSGVPLEITTFDGYHRLFLARLFGHRQIPCDFVSERDALPDPSA